MKQNFKTLACIFAAATIAIFTVSCKKEYLPDEATEHIIGVERHITTSASLPQSADKAYLDETDGRKVKWELTDALNINGTNLPLASLNADATTARFEGTAYAMTSGSNDIYWAVYPTTIVGAASGSTIPSNFTATTLKVNFPATQTYDASDNTLRGNTFMAAYTTAPSGENNIEFQMRNLGAILELDMTPYCNNNTRVDSIVFTSSNAMLAGTFTVSNNATNPTIAPATGSTNKLVVTIQNGSNNYIDITGGKKVRVLLPPLAGKNLNMKIYGTNGRYMEKNATSINLARNNFYSNTISNVTFEKSDVVGFSVAADRRVLFAPGNLQYQASGSSLDAGGNLVGGTWRFAENQWVYIGNAAGNNTWVAARSTQADWIDYFGWGTSGWNSGAIAYLPYSDRMGANDFYPGGDQASNLTGTYAQADWGVYNAIYNPKTGSTDPAGTWRTLTKDEWYYICNREIAINCTTFRKMHGLATVNGVNGLVILPDNWNPASCPSFVYGNSAWSNIFSETTTPKWSQMEALGCVFLPAAGCRINGITVSVGTHGFYWSSSCIDATSLSYLRIVSNNVTPNSASARHSSRSVRLVKEVQ